MIAANETQTDWSAPSQKSIDDDRPIKVICIGAGISGMLTAIRFPQKIKKLELVIYDKSDDIGGTWHENRYSHPAIVLYTFHAMDTKNMCSSYPGVACDIPAHSYQFTFANNLNWSSFYAAGPEIHRYLKNVARRYDVERYVKLRHLFLGAQWQASDGKWEVEIEELEKGRKFTDRADILIKATGILNRWEWPDIPGLRNFKGTLLHSADRKSWETRLDPKGKRIAVIGGGSSGIQIVPQLQPTAARIDHYMKGKTWVSPVGYGSDKSNRGVTDNYKYSADELRMFREKPEEYLRYRREIERIMNAKPEILFKGTEEQKAFFALNDESMKQKLSKKPHIYESLRPDFSPFCRRLTPGPGFLEALVEDNVDFIGCGIDTVVENGIKANDGKVREVDVIICATGYDTSMENEPPIVGLDGTTLADIWNPDPQAYLSICVPKMPNFFIYFGPNGGAGSGSAIFFLESVTLYLVKLVQKIQREYLKSMVVTEQATSDFVRHVDEYFSKTVFTETCKSWFKRNKQNGRVTALWPGASIHTQKALENPRFEDFEYEYLEALGSNTMAWLGNGTTVAQVSGQDTTDYLVDNDIPPPIVEGIHEWDNDDQGGSPLTLRHTLQSTFPRLWWEVCRISGQTCQNLAQTTKPAE
ncbi:uncharacterized protein Z520_05617 [Fonsecaea multimorphosa CBS 102226]|uniref:FAD/NAD(P)-binding domain-containing protein n=1 Tax=Fonsecaea multimorphosa CBS 102226 TaxID=1442371 RepID=A0A0D2IMP8_9EURO|nr:uncharacterized protein Z520_05617 [Fonsecaea multimorphosa CBS 102226]KIX98316.1 hypothetical protein Z520_05617 [Fonsecaea multimorphosa CBS 102226]